MVLVLTSDGQRELGGVEQLDGQSTANLHLADVVRGIEAQASGGGPVTHASAPNFSIGSFGTTTLPLDFDIFL